MARITRRAFAVTALGAASMALANVGTMAQSSDIDAAIAWAKENLPNSTPEIIKAAAGEGQLVLTLQGWGDDVTTTALIKKFNERYPFLNVTYTMQNGAQIVKKFGAEQSSGKGVTDYLQLPSDRAALDKMIADGAFAQFVVSQDAAYPDDAKQAGYWYPWLRQSNVTVYRPDALTAEEKELVRTYAGLGDPRFKGRLGIISGATSNGKTGSYLLQFGSDPSVWERLVANKPVVKPSAAPMLDALMAGEYDVALMSGLPTAVTAKKAGAPIEFLITTPSPVLFGPGAISSIAPHPNAAKLFADWAMSKEGSSIWTALVDVPPARSDVPDPPFMREPWFYDDRQANKPLDWKAYAVEAQKVLDRFQADMQGG